MSAKNIAIIGAGLSGSVLARTLVDAGYDVSVFEKSGGTGGRLATRRTAFGAFNHGAQYLTAKSASFRAMLTGLSNVGAVDEWEPDGKDRNGRWHIGLPGMSGLVKPLLNDARLIGRMRVTSVNSDGDEIKLASEDKELGVFDRVLVTVPAPQAYDLLVPFDPVFQSLSAVRYAPCWTLMAAYEARHHGPEIVRCKAGGSIGWMAKAFEFKDGFGIVAQACAGWSQDNLELSKEDAAKQMLGALEEQFGWINPVYTDAHRWRYALVERSLGTAFLSSRCGRVFCAGDGLLGARAEDAFESARMLADHLKSEIGSTR
ncbi:MAG: FAD-dependent oxidoreductase [Pseudomonadota bacterium]